ncbi:DUF4595 domain-containing protein [uncultured Bacteroides sp.]|mgnify:CR=1 FL=1|uniref:DUF4595 domain-containing protein n=1 Tax=uncultured Bacteroides sp. TaxID=162156 RepID=UPI0025CC31A0|nr:DUF4595 domain-containing protein [uncultured Bacteroides sp.]
MKKYIIVALCAMALFSCSDEEDNTWAIIFKENVRSDADPVYKTEKFLFDNERLIQHSIEQMYAEDDITHEVNLTYSDNKVTVSSDGLTLIYTLNAEGYASQCIYSSPLQNRIYSFSYSMEGYLTKIVESIDGKEHSTASFTYEDGDLTSVSSYLNNYESKFIYEPGEASSNYHLPCLGLLEIYPLNFHIEALYAGLLGKDPRHFTVRSSPEGNDDEHTTYTYKFDKEGNPTKMGCETMYAKGQQAIYYPNTRSISISFE